MNLRLRCDLAESYINTSLFIFIGVDFVVFLT